MTALRKSGRDERDALFTKLWNQGLSHEVISQRTGLARNSIQPTRRRLGLEPRTGNDRQWS